MYIVGVDIAKRKHEAIVIDSEGAILCKPFSFTNDAAGFAKLLFKLNALSDRPEDFEVGMESTSHYWYALKEALDRRGYLVHVLNPIQSNALRGLYIRQVKNDSRDSFLIAEVIRFGRYTEGQILVPELYTLRELCRARCYLADMAGDVRKKIIALLDQVFPEYESVFSDILGVASSALLLRASTPREMMNLDDQEMCRILSKASNNKFRMAKVQQIKELAAQSFGTTVSDIAIALLIKQHVLHLRFLNQQIKEISSDINRRFSQFDTCVCTIPGVGRNLGPVIFSEIGDISRFSSAAKLAAFAGIDPTVTQSGQFTGTHNHMSKRGSPYLRRAIWQAATIIVQTDPVMQAFFQKKRAEGKTYMNAIGHVTRKLTNIIYAVMRDNKPYKPRSV